MKGQDEGRGGVKVSWEQVCLPEKEGDLGLKRVEDWNKPTVIKHIWNPFHPSWFSWGTKGQKLLDREDSSRMLLGLEKALEA